MIRYALECSCGARFEAWFRNAKGCDEQLAADAVSCPVCAGTTVSKSLMAPSVPKRETSAEPVQTPEPPSEAEPMQAPPAPKDAPGVAAAYASRAIEEKLRALRAHIEATAEGVGKDFAKEARAIHEGDAEERPIYGEATRDEVQDLLDDDIPVAPVPWIDRRDD